MLAVRLPKDIETRLEVLSERTGRTKTYYVREAIVDHLEDLEDIYLAEQTLTEIRAGKQKTVGIEKLATEYGIQR
jgi:Predicted DNA-binding protein with an HTH domain